MRTRAGSSHGSTRIALKAGVGPVIALLLWALPVPASHGAANAPTDLRVGFTKSADLPEGFQPRWNFASEYFPPDDQVVLFGGAPVDLATTWRNDTWLYTAGTWQEGPGAPAGLTPRGGSAMAYDPDIGMIVLFGGEARLADGSEVWPPYSNETWLWDGSTWSRGPSAPAGLGGRTGAQMVYDKALHRIVLFGGSGLRRFTDTWLFDGTTWTRGPDAPPEMAPPVFFGMAYDEAGGQVVVGGGDGGSDVWLFDGTAWSPGPSFPDDMVNNRRERTRMAYDPQLEAVLLFGGLGPSAAQEEIYFLRTSMPGSTWRKIPERPPTPGRFSPPKPRMDGSVVWVPTQDAMFFFGGFFSGVEGKIGLTDTYFFRDVPAQADGVVIAPDPPLPTQPLDATVGPITDGYFSTNIEIRWAINGDILAGETKAHLDPQYLPGDVVQAQVRVWDGVGVAGPWISSNAVIVIGSRFQASDPVAGGPVAAARKGFPAGEMVDTHLGVPDEVPLGSVPAGNRGRARSAPNLAADCSSPTPGQIVACDGGFWQDGTAILLHGLNTSGIFQEQEMTRKDYERIAALHMNIVRMRVGWQQFEPIPPTKNIQGVWVHHYATGLVPALVDQIRLADEQGIASLIESRCFCGHGWPLWLGDARFNSHQKTYDLQSEEGRLDFKTDYWSDPLMQKFTKDWAVRLAKWVVRSDGIVGYEPLVEPSSGKLVADHTTTQLIMDWQLELAKAVRAVDPDRVIFFATRGSSGVGIGSADLSGWTDLGNVAFDPHDFFGARWGGGMNLAGDPENPRYGEAAQILFNFTLNPDMPPYLGTIEGQARFLETFKQALASTGIPVFIGEFTGNTEGHPRDPNILSVYGTMSHAMNLEGISWTALSYDGFHSLYNPDGTIRPWAPILCNAAAYPKIVTDCPVVPP